MTRNRRTRLMTVLFALLSLMSMQLAIAGYLCPGHSAKVAEVAAMAEAGMPCAESMAMTLDGERPNLCHAHCQTSQQSADKYQPPSFVSLAALPADFSMRVLLPPFSEASLQAPHLQRTTAPPTAIRNCCFRL